MPSHLGQNAENRLHSQLRRAQPYTHFIVPELDYVARHDFTAFARINLAVDLYHPLRDDHFGLPAARHQVLEFEDFEQLRRLLNDFYFAHCGRNAPLIRLRRNPVYAADQPPNCPKY